MGFKETIEKIADEVIAFTVVGSTTYFVYKGIEVPTWWASAFTAVVMFYFGRKAVRDLVSRQ